MDEKRTELDKKQWTRGTNKRLLVTSFGFSEHLIEGSILTLKNKKKKQKQEETW